MRESLTSLPVGCSMEVMKGPTDKEPNPGEQFTNDDRWHLRLSYGQPPEQDKGLGEHAGHQQRLYQQPSHQPEQSSHHLQQRQELQQQQPQGTHYQQLMQQQGDVVHHRQQHARFTQQHVQTFNRQQQFHLFKQQHQNQQDLPQEHNGQNIHLSQQQEGQQQQDQQRQIDFTKQQQNNKELYKTEQQHGNVDILIKNENTRKEKPDQKLTQSGEKLTFKVKEPTGERQLVKEEKITEGHQEQKQNIVLNKERINNAPQDKADLDEELEQEQKHEEYDMEEGASSESDPEWEGQEQKDNFSEEQEQSDEPSPEGKKPPKVRKKRKDKEKYSCPRCYKSFSSKCKLAVHQTTHKATCFVCDKRFKHEIELEGHMRDHEGETTPYWCERCDKKYDTLYSLKRHRSICGRFECSVCKKVFCHKLYFKDHMATHGEDNKNKCEICGKHFSAAQSKKIHMALHKDETPLECDVCGERFKYQVRLTYHMKKHSEKNDKLECVVCCMSLNGKTSYDEHMEIHINNKEFECKFCVKRFDLLSRRAGHEGKHLLKSESSEDPEEENEDIDAFDCSECQLSFTDQHFLEDHLQDVHDMSSDVPSSETPPRKKSPYFECNICERLFNTPTNLDAHFLNGHCNDTKQLPESNKIKNSRSSDRVNSLASKRVIPPSSTSRAAVDKHYTCELCNKTVEVDTISKHMRDHGEKKFVCRFCGMKFLHVGNAKRHMLIHSNEETHACALCDRKFRSYKNLLKHKNRHRDGKKSDRIRKYGCDQCGKAFMSNYHLKRHMNSHKSK